MQVQIQETGTAFDIHVEGEIEMSTIKAFRDRLYDLIEHSGKNISVDLSRVSYIDSSGIGVLLTAARELKKRGRSLKIENPSERIQGVIKISAIMDLI